MTTYRIRTKTVDPQGKALGNRRFFAVFGSCLFLTACATTPEPQIITKEVKVPVPVACPIDTSEPDYIDTLEALKSAASKGPDAVVALLLGGREQRITWGEGVKKQVGACGARKP